LVSTDSFSFGPFIRYIPWRRYWRYYSYGTRGSRRKQPLDELKDACMYWKLKENARDCMLWKPLFGGVYGPMWQEI